MWNWDQGRLDYFQFDNLKEIARFALNNDLRLTDRSAIVNATDLPFLPNNDNYRPWRNYSRVFRLSMICVEAKQGALITPLGKMLATDGGISTDEYFHFLVQATTDPSPALSGWISTNDLRYPLLFSLKYMLARAAMGLATSEISEIIAAYYHSGFKGDEGQDSFIELINNSENLLEAIVDDIRQAAESIQVIAQISYLSLEKRLLTVSLDREDALDLFNQLQPIGGECLGDGPEEVYRLTEIFESAISDLVLDYASTSLSDVEASGFSSKTTFSEGAKARKTHLVIERNSKIRSEYFKKYPSAICDFCDTDTNKYYPWTPRILDIHHLLPLCSGARTSKQGTLLDDLVAVCPTCHRGVHRYYDHWLKSTQKKDFSNSNEAKSVYQEAKEKFKAAQEC